MSEFPKFSHNREDRMPLVGNPIYAALDTTPAFGARTPTIWQEYHGQSNLVIQNFFFNQFVIGADLLGFYGCNNIIVMDCDFDSMPSPDADNRKSIYLQGCTGTIQIIRCRFKNPAHDAIQFNTCHMVGQIAHNKVRGTTPITEDIFSMFQSGGVDANNRLRIWDNQIDGNDPLGTTPGYTSSSGCGINIGDDAQDAGTGFIDVVGNTILNAAQCGIAIAGGNDQTLDSNLIYSIQTGTSNVGMSIWMNGGSLICSLIEARQNRVHWINSGSGLNNGFFQTGNCGTIANLSDNNFNDLTIDPLKLAVNL